MTDKWVDVPTACELCRRPIDDVFIHGATTLGHWARMDEACHDLFGRGLGRGKGQKFEKKADGCWQKTGG